jgi:hypothetical protein
MSILKTALAIVVIFVLVSCGISKPTLTTPPKIIPTPTATAIPLPAMTLKPGDFYFSMDGTQRMLFSRNPTGYTQEDFYLLLNWAHLGGSKLLRIHIITGWSGQPYITKDGMVNEAWARHWDHFFDQAQAVGIYVMPVFAVWVDWNSGKPDVGDSYWKSNPFNQANGGPVHDPTELFLPDSTTQKMWLAWVKTLVERWQGRENIAAWEIFSEINLATGPAGHTDSQGAVSESLAEDFTNKAAAVIRAADSEKRPVTLSLAAGDQMPAEWVNFYKLGSLDFIQIHPYSASLDRELISEVQNREQYNRPIMIGESGLLGSTAIAKNALIGVRHAIWAGIVSGAMNARALWSNDGYAFYTTSDRTLALEYLGLYAMLELPAVNFSQDIDFKGFKPLPISYQPGTQVWGGAVGSDSSVIGWFRDAGCEPPDWYLVPLISGQQVSLTIPGTAGEWKVDFYDTKTGTDLISSVTAYRMGNNVTVNLPDFTEDIVFKMTAQPGTSSSIPTNPPTPLVSVSTTTDAISGKWTGTISNTAGTFSTLVNLDIQPGCQTAQICGNFSTPALSCSGKLFLQEVGNGTFVFVERDVIGGATCNSGGYEYLQLLTDGTLSFKYTLTPDSTDTTNGILYRP